MTPRPFVAVLGERIRAAAARCAVALAVADYRERLHRARAQRVADTAAQADARSPGGTR